MSQTSNVDIVISAATEQASAAIKAFGAQFAAALSVERIVRWMVTASEVIERTVRLAEGVGMAVEAFSDLQNSARLSDVEVGELSQALRIFNNQIAEAGKSGSQAGAISRAMGIDLQGKNTAQILGEVADKFQSYENGAKKSALAQQLFGRGSLEMIAWLNKGSAGLAESAVLASALGATLDKDTVKGAEDVSEAMKKMGLAFAGAGDEIIRTFGPALAWLIDRFTGLTIAVNTAAQMVWTGLLLMGSAAVDLLTGNLAALKKDWGIFNTSIDQELNDMTRRVNVLLKARSEGKTGTGSAPATGMATGDQKALADLNGDIFELNVAIELSQENMVTARDDYDRELISAEQYYQRINAELEEQLVNELAIIQLKRDYIQKALREELKNKGDSNDLTVKEIELIKERDQLILEEQKLTGDYRKKRYDNTQAAEDATFTGGLRKAMKDMDSFSDHGKAAATIFRNTFGTAIQGISNGIMGLIRGTMTWGQAMLKVGDMVIENIVQMILEYTVFHQLRMLFDKIFHAAAKVNIATTSDAGMIAAMANAGGIVAADDIILEGSAPAAVAESGASWGGNWIVGLAIGIAAIAALMAAFGSFEFGGLVPGGEQLVRINESGPEFVMPARTVQQFGVPFFESLRAGYLPVNTYGAWSAPATSSATPAQAGRTKADRPVNIHFAQVTDRNSMRAFMAGEGIRMVIGQLNKRSNKVSL